MELERKGEGKPLKTLLFLYGGPYFWPESDIVRKKYELLSKYYRGYILSFVSRKEYRRVRIGNFELKGFLASELINRSFVLRNTFKIIYLISRSLSLNYFGGYKIDCIIAYDPFFTGVIAFVLGKLIGTKFITEVNGTYGILTTWKRKREIDFIDFLKFKYVQFILPKILNRAHGVKLLYNGQIDHFRKVKKRRFFVFHDFVSVSAFNSQGDDKYILFIGSPWYLKGVDILIKAFNLIAKEFSEYRLKIVGYLPEKEKPEHIHLFRDNEQIEFVGPLFYNEINSIMGKCSLYVLPSRSEAMSRVLLEAMASRKPIIASNVGGIPAIIKDRYTGLLFESENIEELATKMKLLLEDKNYANKLTHNAYEYVHKYLSEEQYIKHFKCMIEEVM